MFHRIRFSLTAWYVAVLFAIVLVMGIVTYVALSRSLEEEVDESLASSGRAVALQITGRSFESLSSPAAPSPTPRATPRDAEEEEGEEGRDEDEDHGEEEDEDDEHVQYFTPSGGDTFYLVLSPAGETLVNPSNVGGDGIPDMGGAREALANGSAWSTVSAPDGDIRLYSLAVQDDGNNMAVVQVGRSLAEHERQLTTLLMTLAVAGGVGLALAAVGGLILTGRALRPIRASFERQRAFVSDASHELRTPLTIIRGNAELVALSPTATLGPDDRRDLADVVDQAQYLEQLVAHLSLLARSDEGRLPLDKQPVSVQELVHDAARAAEALSRENSVTVEVSAPGDVVVLADPLRIRELMLVLVENAVAHTPPSGRITVSASVAGNEVAISVEDTGPGIPPEHLPHIFDRFYRADDSRSRSGGGTGLGLSIAQAIAVAHGGRIDASNREAGGAKMTVRLPLAAT